MENRSKKQHVQTTSDLDPESFTWLKDLSYKENLKALNTVQFLRSPTNEDQYLDVGGGPGNFLAEKLLPRLRPFARVVSTDVSEDMIEYAREHHKEPKVCFEVMDIENGDAQFIADKYGLFDRAYSFLTFHYIWDLRKAYRNISRLLRDGGECLVVYFTKTGITDVWHQIYQNEEWRPYMPDLSSMFAERYCFDKAVDDKKLTDLEGSAVKAEGLQMVACHTYSSLWTFSSADSCLDAYLPFFKLDDKVPEEKQAAFRETWRSALREASISKTGPISLVYEVIVVHSHKPPAST